MRMSYDDQYLFTVSEDACLFIFKAVDKEGRGMKRDKEVGYAEEILITKSDLEEKVSAEFSSASWISASIVRQLKTLCRCCLAQFVQCDCRYCLPFAVSACNSKSLYNVYPNVKLDKNTYKDLRELVTQCSGPGFLKAD